MAHIRLVRDEEATGGRLEPALEAALPLGDGQKDALAVRPEGEQAVDLRVDEERRVGREGVLVEPRATVRERRARGRDRAVQPATQRRASVVWRFARIGETLGCRP